MPRAMNEHMFEKGVAEEEDDDLNPDEVTKTRKRQERMIVEQAEGGVLPSEKDEELIGLGGEIQEKDFSQLDTKKAAPINPKSKRRLIGNYPKID